MPTYVIPCSGAKLDAPAAARDLYTGPMFRMALAAAEALAEDGDSILVLSALHGLVELGEVVAPYDVKMGESGSVTADVVAAQAQALGLTWEAGADVYALLPRAYFSVLDEALRSDDVYASDVYEATIGIGEHRKVCRVTREAWAA